MIAPPANASIAIAAAHAAAEVATELLRFAKEGPVSKDFALEPETIERLTDALKMAIDIDIEGVRATHPPGAELLGQLHTACRSFLENWA